MQKQISKKVFSNEISPSLSDVTTSLYRLFLARHSWLDSNWSLIGFFNNSLLIFWKLSDLQLFLESEKTSNYSRPQIFKEYVKIISWRTGSLTQNNKCDFVLNGYLNFFKVLWQPDSPLKGR